MKHILLTCIAICLLSIVSAQQDPEDSIQERIIFIGNAGSISKAQTNLISDASSRVLPGKTKVIYLGNNIYPRGFAIKDSLKRNNSETILKSQYEPFLLKKVPVYFIPGNRDWDNGGPEGLNRINEESQYIINQSDSLLQFLPPAGCPDPVLIPITSQLCIIVLDTEWWLFPYNKTSSDTSCECKNQQDVLGSLRALLYQNRNKTIILVSQHPFRSYGPHGGFFDLKNNLFPLTDINPYFYLPLPVFGSLYPLFRKAFPNREDLRHTNYQNMIRDILHVFENFPNLILVSSHDNGAQLLKESSKYPIQVVTGIGKKKPFIKKGSTTLFTDPNPGYLIIDQLKGNLLQINFFNYTKGKTQWIHNFTRNYPQLNSTSNFTYKPITTDSLTLSLHPSYNQKGKFFRLIMGNNYRAEWAAPVDMPVLHLSKIDGGLTPEKLGGGMQTLSLRLKNPSGKEFVLRSVEKTPDRIIPNQLMSSITREIVSDVYSAQHPYSALIVPPIAHAAGIPHAHPQIGLIAPDSVLGVYQTLFAGKVNLLEEREPLSGTVNYSKAITELKKDNDNSYDAINFLKARMLDLLIGDWDRHTDQWRFHDLKEGKGKHYIIVPRDRDMALNVTNGLMETIAKYFYLTPHVYGFKKNLLSESNDYLYKSRFMEPYMASQINFNTWMNTANQFKEEVTDSVLTEAVHRFPKGLDTSKNNKILQTLKIRRNLIPQAMKKYYRFDNRIVDVMTSEKNELVSVLGQRDTLHLLIQKMNNTGHIKDTLVSKFFAPSVTKEIRIYLEKGNDSVFINNTTPIKIRLIGGKTKKDDYKSYVIANSRKQIHIYDYRMEHYIGQTQKVVSHISKDKGNLEFVPVNLYNTIQPLATAALNLDDGFILGLGTKFILQRGFRKTPYTSQHKLMISHSFSTGAFEIKYGGDWLESAGKLHLLLDADIKAPDNLQNFFGVGNETPFDKTGDYKRFYRARFELFTLSGSLRWVYENKSTFTLGPSFQYYHYPISDNLGRFITYKNLLHSSDSAIISEDKLHLGLVAEYELDRRNNSLIPSYGVFINIKLQGFTGLNSYSKSFGQILPQFVFYKNLNARQTVVLANRTGGAVTIGRPAFYQYAYLGGQGNLLGFRKFRFAGMNTFFNNLELRLALANFGNSLIKGQIGVSGFYDIGRVWAQKDNSAFWHQGTGGGIYLVPAYAMVLQFNISHSTEGWYPFFTFGFRF